MARRILLADDSVTAQNMGRKILSDAGYEVITVNNGSAALKKIAEQKPDLIVLDVYMPGYSGLEVCQRIKDTRETSRIPILLTVGKLEPFKPEEARRARADAYIVKPFEASELLVALTKLEDKIVPTAEPYKPGRFAKAIAAVERFNHEAPQERFGDKDSGWKARIKFPSPGSKPSEAEAEEIAGKKSLRDDVEVPIEPSRAFDRPMPEGLPKDITPEEIEAITAAAAQFSESGKPAGSSEEMTPETTPYEQPASEVQETERVTAAVSHAQESSDEVPHASALSADEEREEHREEAAPVTFANSPQESSEAEHVSVSGSAPQGEQVGGEAASAEEAPTEVVAQDQFSGHNGDHLQAPEAVSEVNSASNGASDASGIAQPESEVAAALQNLLPPNGNGADQVAVEQAVGQTAGSRWIAESVSLESHETAVALENEMHKAFAAFAAAEGACRTSADAASSSESSQAHAGSSYIDGAAQSDSSPQISQADSHSGAQGTRTSEVGELVSPAPETAPDVPPSATADASVAGEQTETPAMVEASAAEAPEALAPPIDETAQREDKARATAWENWHHVRDAVADSTANVAEAAAAALANSTSEELPAKTEAMAAAAGAGSGVFSEGDSTVASIVDSVLAELKPKLMEEIAKKMKKDQK